MLWLQGAVRVACVAGERAMWGMGQDVGSERQAGTRVGEAGRHARGSYDQGRTLSWKVPGPGMALAGAG